MNIRCAWDEKNVANIRQFHSTPPIEVATVHSFNFPKGPLPELLNLVVSKAVILNHGCRCDLQMSFLRCSKLSSWMVWWTWWKIQLNGAVLSLNLIWWPWVAQFMLLVFTHIWFRWRPCHVIWNMILRGTLWWFHVPYSLHIKKPWWTMKHDPSPLLLDAKTHPTSKHFFQAPYMKSWIPVVYWWTKFGYYGNQLNIQIFAEFFQGYVLAASLDWTPDPWKVCCGESAHQNLKIKVS